MARSFFILLSATVLPIGLEILMTSLKLHYLLETLSPDTVTLGSRVSTYEFEGDKIQSIAVSDAVVIESGMQSMQNLNEDHILEVNVVCQIVPSDYDIIMPQMWMGVYTSQKDQNNCKNVTVTYFYINMMDNFHFADILQA